MSAQQVPWDGSTSQQALALLEAGGSIVVVPTKVGYVIAASDGAGLERKFQVKDRARSKPAVVLCGSLDELAVLARLNPEIERFYADHWEQDVLLGCILPWREEGLAYLPDAVCQELAMDGRGTSCFVVCFGTPAEQLATAMWDEHRAPLFASSANPSGRGNRGVVAGIGEAIEGGVDLVIEADDYVHSIQPAASADTRSEQGVMVSLVDTEGELVPQQHGRRGVQPAPTLIRAGLDETTIMTNLAQMFPSWNYRHGEYY